MTQMTIPGTEGLNPPVHPIANIFPMLSKEELQELADDIKGRGLLHPIVLDSNGHLLDGRNRLAACRLAKKEPSFITYVGDAIGYALASNITRRHLNKGQQAMLWVKAAQFCRDGENDYKSINSIAERNSLSHQRLGLALLVQEYNPEAVDLVISGMVGLEPAHRTAKDRQDAQEQQEDDIEKMRRKYGDLADKVAAEEMDLITALAEVAARERQEAIAKAERDQQVRDNSTGLARTLQWVTNLMAYPGSRASVREDFSQTCVSINYEVNYESIKLAQACLTAFMEEWNDEQN